jgi:hypothetical protein
MPATSRPRVKAALNSLVGSTSSAASTAATPPSTAPARVLAATQLGVGVLLITRPREAARIAARLAGRPAPAALVRTLGVRTALQGAVTGSVRTAPVLASSAVVDVLHGLTMVVVAVRAPRYRGAALVSAAVATGHAALAVAAIRPGRRRLCGRAE